MSWSNLSLSLSSNARVFRQAAIKCWICTLSSSAISWVRKVHTEDYGNLSPAQVGFQGSESRQKWHWLLKKSDVDIELLEGDLIYQKGALPEPVGCSYVQKSVCDWLGLQSTLGLLSHTPDRSLYHISKLSLSVLGSLQFIAMVQRQDWNGMDCNKDIRCCWGALTL